MRKKATAADFMRVSDIAIGDLSKAEALRRELRDGRRIKAAEWARVFVVTASATELREIVHAFADALEAAGESCGRCSL